LEEKIKKDKELKKMDCGQLSKWKKTPTDVWSTLRKRRKDRLAKPFKQGSSGPRVLVPRVVQES
jgi:hypothetical protein